MKNQSRLFVVCLVALVGCTNLISVETLVIRWITKNNTDSFLLLFIISSVITIIISTIVAIKAYKKWINV